MKPERIRAWLDRADAFRSRCIRIAIAELLIGTYLVLLYRGITGRF